MNDTEFLQEMAKQLNEQDNCSTADPIFVVYTKMRIWQVDENYYDARVAWVDQDCEIIIDEDDVRFDALETLCDGDEIRIDGEHYRKSYYTEIRNFEQAFFTQKAAHEYIAQNQHNLRKPYVYAESLYGNKEMCALRDLLKSGGLCDGLEALAEQPACEQKWRYGVYKETGN